MVDPFLETIPGDYIREASLDAIFVQRAKAKNAGQRPGLDLAFPNSDRINCELAPTLTSTGTVEVVWFFLYSFPFGKGVRGQFIHSGKM